MLSHPFTLERGGRSSQLVKHPRDRQLPPEDQKNRPWYVRVPVPGEKNPRWKKVGEAHELETATAAARELLLKARVGGNPFTELWEAARYRSALTVGAVLDAWVAAGCPETNGNRRSEAQRDRQLAALKNSRAWWNDRNAITITGPTLHAFALWRRGQVRDGAGGDRTIDIELTTLSNCFAWAAAVGKVEANPFATRPRFRRSDDVEHCNQFMPADDDELHKLCGLLISAAPVGRDSVEPLNHRVAGAQLLFQALTGLRPGEPGCLRLNARYAEGRPAPGHRYPVTLEGKPRELLAVQRLKGGINPAVEVHPALAAFLGRWLPYVRATWPETTFFFPDPADPKRPFIDPEDTRKRLNTRLNAAATALGLPERHPHAMRAFYVRVRRSHGFRDAGIAEELGQGSGPKEIVRCYGDQRGIFGDGQFDWLPTAPVRPAWELLPAVEKTNVIGLDTKRDTELDTSTDVPESPAESRG